MKPIQELPICPVCGEGRLHEEVAPRAVKYRAAEVVIDAKHSQCDNCETELVSPEQAAWNDQQLRDKRGEAAGLLAPAEYKRIREKLGLTQIQAAKLFGGGPVAFSKYESGAICPNRSLDLWMRYLDWKPAVLEEVMYLSAGRIPAPTVETTLFLSRAFSWGATPKQFLIFAHEGRVEVQGWAEGVEDESHSVRLNGPSVYLGSTKNVPSH